MERRAYLLKMSNQLQRHLKILRLKPCICQQFLKYPMQTIQVNIRKAIFHFGELRVKIMLSELTNTLSVLDRGGTAQSVSDISGMHNVERLPQSRVELLSLSRDVLH